MIDDEICFGNVIWCLFHRVTSAENAWNEFPHTITFKERETTAPFRRVLNGGQNQLVCIKAVGAEEKADLGQVEGVDLVVVEPVHLHDLHLAEVPLDADWEVVHLSVLHAKAFPLKNKDKITQGTETGLTVQEEGDSKACRQITIPKHSGGNPLIVLGNSNAINP